MTKEEYLAYCRSLKGVLIDQPFQKDRTSYIARHEATGKWFGLITELEGKFIVNLKCDPQEALFLRNAFEGVIPAWHMNKEHWNTVYLESDVPKEELERMTEESYRLTSGKKGGKDGK